MPKISDERRDKRRQQILNAAAGCFADHGLHQATLQDIFRRSGLSAGAVYSYYPSKNALLEAVFDHTLRRNRTLLRQIPAGTAREVEDRVVRGFTTMLRDQNTRALARLDVELFAHASRDATLRAMLSASLRALEDAISARINEDDKASRAAARGILARVLGEMLLGSTQSAEQEVP